MKLFFNDVKLIYKIDRKFIFEIIIMFCFTVILSIAMYLSLDDTYYFVLNIIPLIMFFGCYYSTYKPLFEKFIIEDKLQKNIN